MLWLLMAYALSSWRHGGDLGNHGRPANIRVSKNYLHL